VIFELNRDMQG